MRRFLLSVTLLIATTAGSLVSAAAGRNQAQSLAQDWPVGAGNELRDSFVNGAGFSFTYGGKKYGPVDWSGWEIAREELRTTYRHPSGLTVVRTAKLQAEYDSVEYTLVFRNEGETDLPNLTEVKAIDVSFNRPAGQVDLLTSSAGAERQRIQSFPPARDECFTLTQTPLSADSAPVTFGSLRGKPSGTSLPFFYIQNQARNAGLIVGLGWTGAWGASIGPDLVSHDLRIQGGMEGLDLSLRPGEEISSPVILLGGWSGSMEVGVNRLRRLINTHYAPRVDGKKLVPPIMYTTWFQIGAEMNEQLVEGLIDRAAEMGQEIFEIDAAWYNGTPYAKYTNMSETWPAISNSLGNWEEGPDKIKFPSGLKPLADRVRARGMEFGLWFEPERAGKPSRLAREHPEWMTTIPDSKWLAVNLGLPAAQEYFRNMFDRYIQELDIRYIRWDMNHISIMDHWQTKDTPNRRGLYQIRHLEGLHQLEEYLLAKHPGVIIESCASGGMRIDLPTLARRHTMWVSDAIDTKVVRYMLEGLNQFLPGNGQLVALSIPADEARDKDFVLRDYNAQVGFGGAFGLSGRIHEWSDATRKTVRRNVDVYKQLRSYLAEDFYMLMPQARTEETWAGWQFHDPKTEAGFIQVFRVHAAEAKHTFHPRAIDPGKTYELRDPYTNERSRVSGKQLLQDGLSYSLPELSSKILIYKPVKG